VSNPTKQETTGRHYAVAHNKELGRAFHANLWSSWWTRRVWSSLMKWPRVTWPLPSFAACWQSVCLARQAACRQMLSTAACGQQSTARWWAPCVIRGGHCRTGVNSNVFYFTLVPHIRTKAPSAVEVVGLLGWGIRPLQGLYHQFSSNFLVLQFDSSHCLLYCRGFICSY